MYVITSYVKFFISKLHHHTHVVSQRPNSSKTRKNKRHSIANGTEYMIHIMHILYNFSHTTLQDLPFFHSCFCFWTKVGDIYFPKFFSALENDVEKSEGENGLPALWTAFISIPHHWRRRPRRFHHRFHRRFHCRLHGTKDSGFTCV